eukprot:6171893-Pleurochrysis_carterae.AAC.2
MAGTICAHRAPSQNTQGSARVAQVAEISARTVDCSEIASLFRNPPHTHSRAQQRTSRPRKLQIPSLHIVLPNPLIAKRLVQVAEVVETLCAPHGLRVALFHGGVPYPPQQRALREVRPPPTPAEFETVAYALADRGGDSVPDLLPQLKPFLSLITLLLLVLLI